MVKAARIWVPNQLFDNIYKHIWREWKVCLCRNTNKLSTIKPRKVRTAYSAIGPIRVPAKRAAPLEWRGEVRVARIRDPNG